MITKIWKIVYCTAIVRILLFQVRDNVSDATIVSVENQQQARESQLLAIAHEITDDHYFIAVDKTLSDDQLYKVPMYVSRFLHLQLQTGLSTSKILIRTIIQL